MPEDARSVCRIPLNAQEEEFAAACRDFVLERKPDLGASITIVNNELTIANDLHIRQAFIQIGLARLIRVLHLAVEGKSIPIGKVPKLLFDLALFKTKVLGSLGKNNKTMVARIISSLSRH